MVFFFGSVGPLDMGLVLNNFLTIQYYGHCIGWGIFANTNMYIFPRFYFWSSQSLFPTQINTKKKPHNHIHLLHNLGFHYGNLNQ